MGFRAWGMGYGVGVRSVRKILLCFARPRAVCVSEMLPSTARLLVPEPNRALGISRGPIF